MERSGLPLLKVFLILSLPNQVDSPGLFSHYSAAGAGRLATGNPLGIGDRRDRNQQTARG